VFQNKSVFAGFLCDLTMAENVLPAFIRRMSRDGNGMFN
jgi:hypothetical protein